jgi:hypothetical protein
MIFYKSNLKGFLLLRYFCATIKFMGFLKSHAKQIFLGGWGEVWTIPHPEKHIVPSPIICPHTNVHNPRTGSYVRTRVRVLVLVLVKSTDWVWSLTIFLLRGINILSLSFIFGDGRV